MIPALVGVVLAVPAMAASLALAREREWGTLEGLIATPIRRSELIVGKIIPYVLAGMLSVPFCIATAVYGYHVPSRAVSAVYVLSRDLFIRHHEHRPVYFSLHQKPASGDHGLDDDLSFFRLFYVGLVDSL